MKPRKILVCPECGGRLVYRKMYYKDHNVSIVSGRVAVTRRSTKETPAPPMAKADLEHQLVCSSCGEIFRASPTEFVEEYPHMVLEEGGAPGARHHSVKMWSQLQTWSVKDSIKK